jgi:eukaryotic-like serine/threonine-protein kinase
VTLDSGQSLLHYRLASRLGAGGMGEVWRATDTTLGREVAIKVLPAAFSTDPERLARFEREAKMLASLNHPSIAAIYGLHESSGMRFLAMELVPGEDLSVRIGRGRLSVPDAVEITRQIAEALDAAHEQGIVHRDLKPANVKLTPDHKVKVLDFGLAKALDAAGGASADRGDTGMSPTVTSLGTVAGVILGTAAYMSPEQARGRAVDRRADTWALGVILYEMLTGRRPFDGETVSDTLASVLKTDPDWGALPADTPAGVRRLLHRCLAKDPGTRLRSAGDAIFDLEDQRPPEATPPSVTTRSAWGARAPWAIAGVLAAVLAVALWGRGAARPPERRLATHIEYAFGSGSGVVLAPPTVSPDGSMIVYGERSKANVVGLWLRRIDSFDAKELPETKDAIFPFWSPDSRSIAYFVGASLRRIDVQSESTQVISEKIGWARGGSWHASGGILFAPSPNSPIFLTAASGGEAKPVTELDLRLPDVSHRFPQWLPDGRHFLYTLWSNNADVQKDHGGIYVGSTDAGFQGRRVLADASGSIFVPPGRLLLHRRGKLIAVPFNAQSLTVGDDANAIDSDVTFALSSGTLAASASLRGDVAYATGTGEPDTELLWMDRNGRTTLALNQSGQFGTLAVAPDGQRFATERSEGMTGQQIWIGDAARATIVPLTHGSNDSLSPAWSPDGRQVAFTSRETGNEDIYVQDVAGTKPWEMVHDSKDLHDTNVTDWSDDGRLILFDSHPRDNATRTEVWQHDLGAKSARAILKDVFSQYGATLSHDGRWLAYTSTEGDSPQVFIRPFPALDRKWLVSGKNSDHAHWRSDGKELLYASRDESGEHLWSVPLSPDASAPNPGTPRELFPIDPRIVELAPTEDHTRFLVARVVPSTGRNTMRVVLDWR